MLSDDGSALGRLGIILLLLGVVFLFKYSVDRGWITPVVRVAFGYALGAGLLVAATRIEEVRSELRALLQGGAVAAFFLSGWAAYDLYGLIPYAAAVALLVLAALLGLALALRSDHQALGVVAILGASATPFLLTPPSPSASAQAAYLVVLLAAAGAIYWYRGWRDVLWVTFVAGWLAFLVLAIDRPGGSRGANLPALSLGILVAAAVTWWVPLLRAVRWARDPEAWPRPGRLQRPPSGRWSVHVDALSLMVPLLLAGSLAITWRLEEVAAGWVFLVTAAFARGLGTWARRADVADGHDEIQSLAAVVLTTVALALILDGEALYAALAAEAWILHVAASRGERGWLLRLGQAIGVVPALWFIVRLDSSEALMLGDLTPLIDLAVLAAAVHASRAVHGRARSGYLIAAYAGLLLWITRELRPLDEPQVFISITWGALGAIGVLWGLASDRAAVRNTGVVTLLVVVAKLFLVDLAQVDPLWRVLLFLAIGGLLLFLSRLYERARSTREGG